ncbi:hypothetical protein JHD50_12405 [Sulfurimonas sp. MAG313]|nr:hypothetical protein [Sulfurimonas sp. MAG313]MDF1882090.1 hypothetical protein [Sulfurimonas sp. MAG313]
MRFTIDEYSKAYSISAEMVHSRLRRNRLNYIVEDEITFIVVPKHQVPAHVNNLSTPSKDSMAPKQASSSTPIEKKTTVATVIGLYQKENHYLKMKIDKLEAKVDRLVQDKENLLQDERKRIEKVYKDKDTQLKSILELINIKLIQENQTHIPLASIDEIQPHIQEEIPVLSSEPLELKSYLRSLNLKSSQRKVIKRRFAEAFGSDSRVLLKNGLFYLDISRYDYSDLLKIS